MNLLALSAPFPPASIHWRAQTVTRDGGKALALAFIDARDVMDRLDAVCGPENWQDSYTETAKGRLICTLSIRIGGEWISKSDGAGDTDVEGSKGAISDALKRAAVKWGIGRYLYSLKNVWAPCESSEYNGKKKWSTWAAGADRVFADALAKLTPGHNIDAACVNVQAPPVEIPASVEAFLNGLTAAYANNTAAEYWTQHWPSVPQEWRPYALEQKEQIKTAQGKVALLRAG